MQNKSISFSQPSIHEAAILHYHKNQYSDQTDHIVREEPLEIRLISQEGGRQRYHRICVTMRTPGNDFELAAGFLFTENVIKSAHEIEKIEYSTNSSDIEPQNIVHVYLRDGVKFDEQNLSRHVYTTSSCGICGKTSLELVRLTCSNPPRGDCEISYQTIFQMPEILQEKQTLFAKTGGLHGAALFDTRGQLILVQEDVGRHNAMDKLIGSLFLKEALPAHNTMVLVSGRASFELVQKAALAGIPVFVAIGAPSTLAVELAQEFNMTLIGFLKDDRFNIYHGAHRIIL